MLPFLPWAGALMAGLLGTLAAPEILLAVSAVALAVGGLCLANSAGVIPRIRVAMASSNLLNTALLAYTAKEIYDKARKDGIMAAAQEAVWNVPFIFFGELKFIKEGSIFAKYPGALNKLERSIVERFGPIMERISDSSGKIIYLTENAWKHIKEMHILGKDAKIQFSKFGYNTNDEVVAVIRDTISNGKTYTKYDVGKNRLSTFYQLEKNDHIVTVIVGEDGASIITAFPEYGGRIK